VSDPSAARTQTRVPTGVTGLDTITRGGLFRGGLYIFVGRPGAGKTTLAHQAAFHHVKQGGRVAYVTLLSENHARMVVQMQGMTFYDETCVGTSFQYINGYAALASEGLDGLLGMFRRTVRELHADLLVLDGLMPAAAIAPSATDYKKFINELQTWVGVVGCTVLFLTTGLGNSVEPEYTMVDGIVELRARNLGLRRLRQLSVRKFRGTGFLEGAHPYELTGAGLIVYPRAEAQFDSYPDAKPQAGVLSSGVEGLDRLLSPGLTVGSSTIALGPAGSGKTTLGLQFLAEGARRGEPGVHVGFYEAPSDLIQRATLLSLPLGQWVADGTVQLLWRPPVETILDAIAYDLILAVRTRHAKRLVVDGLAGLKATAYAERLTGFLAVLVQELRALGVTSIFMEAGRRLRLPGVSPAAAASLVDNVVQLEHRSADGECRRTIRVRKARLSANDGVARPLAITARGIVVGDQPAAQNQRARTVEPGDR
jgi:circadian clock protein KaiC